MTYLDILGPPLYTGEIRIIEQSYIPSRRAKSTSEYFPNIIIYVIGNDLGTWTELLDHEVEKLRRKGKI